MALLNGTTCKICRWWFFDSKLQDKLPVLKGSFQDEVWGCCHIPVGELDKWRDSNKNDDSCHVYLEGNLYTISALSCGVGEYRDEFLKKEKCDDSKHEFDGRKISRKEFPKLAEALNKVYCSECIKEIPGEKFTHSIGDNIKLCQDCHMKIKKIYTT